MRIEFTVDTTPRSQPRPRVVRGHAYEPADITEYKELIGMIGRLNMTGRPIFSSTVYVELTFRRRYSRTSRIFGDIDNLAKAVLDALTGVCYTDDALVVRLLTVKEQSRVEGIDIVVTDEI